jgi:hypothetical protein
MSHCSKCSDDWFPCLVSQLRAGCNATANGSGCTEWSIYWTPAARNATAISTPTHTDRTTADGSRRWGRGREGGQRRLDGRWASWLRKSAFRFCGSNEGDRGSSEGKAHPHHERVACCVWPTDHGLITRMAANKSKTPSPRDSWREETCHVETLMLLIGQFVAVEVGGSGEHGVWGHIPAAAPRPRLPARGGQCAATLVIQCLGGVMFVVVCTNTSRPTQERGLGIVRHSRPEHGWEREVAAGSLRCQSRTGPSSKLKRGPATIELLPKSGFGALNPLSGSNAVFRVCGPPAQLPWSAALFISPQRRRFRGGNRGGLIRGSNVDRHTGSRQFGQAGDCVPTGPSTRDTKIACFNFVKQLAKRAHNAAHVT